MPMLVSAHEGEEEHSSAVSTMLDEISITARRRDQAEDLQSVPVAITAFSGEQLDAMQYANLLDITARVPNANAEINATYPGFVNFSMRGTGVRGSALSDEPAVGVFIDGVYQGIAAGMLLDSFDMESVEVLRGPQGTLFGRNVTGGAVLMRTSRPTKEFSARIKALAGNYGTQSLAAVVSGPLAKNRLLGKVAVFYNQRDDYVTNINKGNPLAPNADHLGEKDQLAFRFGLTWFAADNTAVNFRLEHMETDEDATPTDNLDERSFGAAGLNTQFGALSPSGIVAPPFGDPELTGGDLGIRVPHTELDSASLDIEWSLSKGTLQSITGYRDLLQDKMQQDFDNSLVPLFEIWEHEITQEQFSEELLYNVDLSDLVSMTAGLYYFDQEITNNDFRISGGAFGGVGAHITYAMDQSVTAAFASFDIAMSDRLNLSLGARYTDEDKSAAISNLAAFAATAGAAGCPADGALPTLVSGMNPVDSIAFSTCTPSYRGNKHWSNTTPKIGLQYLPNDSSQFYFSYSKGFRSGGFSARGLVTTDPVYDEERVNAFEIGVKYDFEGDAHLNMAIFANDFDDMQRNVFLDVATGEQVTRNAAKATITGAELEAVIPVGNHFLIQGSLGYTDAEYDEYTDGVSDFSGSRIPGISEWQHNLSLIYDMPVGAYMNLTVRGSYSFRSEYHNTEDNLGYVSPARTVYDTSISLSAKRWAITAFGKNLSNETTQGPGIDVELWVATQVYRPRTYGLELTYSTN